MSATWSTNSSQHGPRGDCRAVRGAMQHPCAMQLYQSGVECVHAVWMVLRPLKAPVVNAAHGARRLCKNSPWCIRLLPRRWPPFHIGCKLYAIVGRLPHTVPRHTWMPLLQLFGCAEALQAVQHLRPAPRKAKRSGEASQQLAAIDSVRGIARLCGATDCHAISCDDEANRHQ